MRGRRRLPLVPLFDQRSEASVAAGNSAADLAASGSLLDLDEKQLLAWRMDKTLRGRSGNAQLLPFTDSGSLSQLLPGHQQQQQNNSRGTKSNRSSDGRGVFGS